MVTRKANIMKTNLKTYLISWAIAYVLMLAFIGVKYSWSNMIVGLLFFVAILLSGWLYVEVEFGNLKQKAK